MTTPEELDYCYDFVLDLTKESGKVYTCTTYTPYHHLIQYINFFDRSNIYLFNQYCLPVAKALLSDIEQNKKNFYLYFEYALILM